MIQERNGMETPIKIRFSPERKEYIQASRLLAGKTQSFLIMAGMMGLLTIVSIVILALPSQTPSTWQNIAAIVCLVSGFFLIYYVVFIPFQLMRSYKKDPFLRETRILTFGDKKVRMTIGEKSMDMDWEDVHRVIQSRHLFLMIYKGDEDIYPFIPKRAFEDQSQLETFLQVLEKNTIPLV